MSFFLKSSRTEQVSFSYYHRWHLATASQPFLLQSIAFVTTIYVLAPFWYKFAIAINWWLAIGGNLSAIDGAMEDVTSSGFEVHFILLLRVCFPIVVNMEGYLISWLRIGWSRLFLLLLLWIGSFKEAYLNYKRSKSPNACWRLKRGAFERRILRRILKK